MPFPSSRWNTVRFAQATIKITITHNNFRHCRVSFSPFVRQPFSKQLYTQFIALYVAIAVFNLLLHSVTLWALKIIERKLKTYLSWSKTQREFHQGLQKSTDEKKNVRFPLHWPLVSSPALLWLARKMREAAGKRVFPLFSAAAFLISSKPIHIKWKFLIQLHIYQQASFLTVETEKITKTQVI